MNLRIKICLLSLLLCISLSYNCFSQENKKVIIKFAPLSLINPNGPNIKIGGEILSKGEIAFATDLSLYLPFILNGKVNRAIDRKGIKIKPEIRVYTQTRGGGLINNRGLYFANEVLFFKDHFKRGDTYLRENSYSDNHDDNTYYDYNIINRIEIGDNLKIGYQGFIKDKIILECFAGFGIKYRKSEYEYKVPGEICCPVIRFFEIPTGNGFKPNLTMGFKIGLAL